MKPSWVLGGLILALTACSSPLPLPQGAYVYQDAQGALTLTFTGDRVVVDARGQRQEGVVTSEDQSFRVALGNGSVVTLTPTPEGGLVLEPLGVALTPSP